jgi:hypothetical protein
VENFYNEFLIKIFQEFLELFYKLVAADDDDEMCFLNGVID